MKTVLPIITKYLQRLWRTLLDKDILTFLLFVGMAYLLWMGRTMASQRDASIHIPIRYINIPPEVSFDTPLPPTVHITVQDKGRTIMRLKKDKPTMVLDLESYIAPKNGKFTIHTDYIRKMVHRILPPSTTVIDCSPETIHASYILQQQKQIPIMLKGRWTLASQYQLDRDPIVQPATICVYGTDHSLQRTPYLTTEPFELLDIRDSTSIRVAIDHPDDIRVMTDSVDITFIPEQFTEKRFVLPIHPLSKPQNGILHLFPNEAEVIARIGINDFQQLSPNDFRVLCPCPNDRDSLLTLEVQCQNSAVTQVRINPPIVEFLLERE